MDILATLKIGIEGIPNGPHSRGLAAVLSHIEAAHRHLSRGQREADGSAYIDAIYRCNQAFEGSIKEAYRVLAEKDPSKKTPNDIEQFLEKNHILRNRVLKLFANYRTEWRNPSTHDYTLDFNEAESFLAIISISAFAKILADEISQKLAENRVKDATLPNTRAIDDKYIANLNAVESASLIIMDVANGSLHDFISANDPEPVITGTIAGLLEISDADNIKSLSTGVTIDGDRPIDLLLETDKGRVIVEVRRGLKGGRLSLPVSNLDAYMKRVGVHSGIILAVSEGDAPYSAYGFGGENGEVVVVMREESHFKPLLAVEERAASRSA